MKFHKIIPILQGQITGLELGHAISDMGKDAWIGVPTYDHFNAVIGYKFFDKGHHYGHFTIPKNLEIGTEIHVSTKGVPLDKRDKWVVVDFDEKCLLFKRKDIS